MTEGDGGAERGEDLGAHRLRGRRGGHRGPQGVGPLSGPGDRRVVATTTVARGGGGPRHRRRSGLPSRGGPSAAAPADPGHAPEPSPAEPNRAGLPLSGRPLLRGAAVSEPFHRPPRGASEQVLAPGIAVPQRNPENWFSLPPTHRAVHSRTRTDHRLCTGLCTRSVDGARACGPCQRGTVGWSGGRWASSGWRPHAAYRF